MERIEFLIAPVRRHLTGQADLAGELARRSVDFRDMCRELRDAEAALEAVAALPAGLRAERQAECLGWIERLKREIAGELAMAKVVPLPRPGAACDPRNGRCRRFDRRPT